MANVILKKHSFEEKKNKLLNLINKEPEDLSISKVETAGWLFGLNEHKVTGSEMNNITTQIQKRFMTLNQYHLDTLKMFNQVYEVFDKLDKEYIDGIVGSVKAAGFASEQALKAQKDADRVIDGLKLTVQKLKLFSERLEKIEHIENIDELWQQYIDLGNTFDTLKSTVKVIWDFKENALKTLGQFDVDIHALKVFDNQINEQVGEINIILAERKKEFLKLESLLNSYVHLADIDNIYDDTQDNKAEIKTILKDLSSANGNIESNKVAIEENNKEIEENKKLIKQKSKDFTNSLEDKQKQIEDLKNKIDTNFEMNQTAINDNFACIQRDETDIKNLQDNIVQLNNSIDEKQERIEQLQKLLEREKESNIEKQQYLFNNIKIAYAIAGSSALAIIINFILQISGVL